MFSSNQMDNILQPTKVDSQKLLPVKTLPTSNSTGNISHIDSISVNEERTPSTVAIDLTSLNIDFDLSYLETKDANEPQQQQTSNPTNTLIKELLCDIYPTATKLDKTSAPSPSPSSSSNNELILTPQFTVQQPTIQPQINSTIIKTNIEPMLSEKAIDLFDKLPNLNFMKSKVLMFPVNSGSK